MNDGAIFATLIDVYKLAYNSNRSPDEIIKNYFSSRRYAGSKDRRRCISLLFSLFRNKVKIDFVLQDYKNNDNYYRLSVLLFLVAIESIDYNYITELSDLPHSFNKITSDERKILEEASVKIKEENLPIWAKIEIPEDILPLFNTDELALSNNSNLADFLSFQNTLAPVYLRVNNLLVSRNELLERLAKQDFMATKDELLTNCIIVNKQGKIKLTQTAEFKSGLFIVQDRGSQIITEFINTADENTTTIVDYCSGAGGKSLGMSFSNPLAKIIAGDIFIHKLNENKKRQESCRCNNITLYNWINYTFKHEVADWLLVDAPCSGSGTWRRHMSAKFNHELKNLQKINQIKKDIFSKSIPLLKSGGIFLYATCSLYPLENQDMTKYICDNYPNLRPKPLKELNNNLATMLGLTDNNQNDMLLDNYKHNCDGFYFAAFVKV